MLYPTKAKLGYIFTLERLLRLRARLCFYLAIFFIYLLIIYPACPARDEKSDDPPARVVAFSFVCGCPLGWDAPECPPLYSGYADDPYFASIIGKTVTQITFYAADGVYVLPVNVAL